MFSGDHGINQKRTENLCDEQWIQMQISVFFGWHLDLPIKEILESSLKSSDINFFEVIPVPINVNYHPDISCITLMAVLIPLLLFSGPVVSSQLSDRQADTPQYS